jgi:hypothetical protein
VLQRASAVLRALADSSFGYGVAKTDVQGVSTLSVLRSIIIINPVSTQIACAH